MSSEYCSCSHLWRYHGSNGCGVKNGHDEYCMCQTPPPETEKEIEERRQRLLLYPCQEHKRYALKRKPTSGCEKCWKMWITWKKL
jgi:hypothetical protein